MVDRDAAWWLDNLTKRLDIQAGRLRTWDNYFNGSQPLGFSTVKYRKEFEAMVKAISDNWMPLLCEAVNERLHVDGFRFGENPAADDDAHLIWQGNGLDSESELLHMDALKYGISYTMVWRDEEADAPTITVEHPSEVTVVHSPMSARKRLAALKRWRDEYEDASFAVVYLPDGIHWFRTDDANSADFKHLRTIENPTGLVPVVAFRNRMNTKGDYRSELDGFLSTQDQINKLVADMIVASEFGAFRQRWATGLEVMKDPQTGKPMQPFESAVDRLFIAPAPDARFGSFEATDLKHYIDAITSRIQSLASRSRTPPHYLLASGVFPNGESTKAAETGLVAKVRSRMRAFGEAWEDTMRLAFAVMADQRAYENQAEVIWADPESRTESEHIDSLVKKLALGVPKEQLWSDAGYSPTQIKRFKEMARTQALTEAMAAPIQVASVSPRAALPVGSDEPSGSA